MRIITRVEPASSLRSHLDALRISERLRADIEHELQASIASEQLLDPEQRRAALERAVQRLAGAML
ncbi:MAG TPA: hypothetical protein VJ233_03140 [Hyphomicrobiaceae bacterium]|nr:hypothetical protein [Hyphomicrobiaceae bacterium]